MKSRHLKIGLGSALLLVGLAGSAWAANIPVAITNYAFVPMSVNINVNDTVTWTWQTDDHSSTANSGLWDSGVYNTGYVYSYTFLATGDFPYYCIVHGFTGDVNVQVPSSPPTVTLTNPPSGATYSAPATIQLAATTLDTNGTVASVQFYEGANLLATQITGPYSLSVSNLAAGPYTFAAVATDTNGLSATNSVSVQVVTPVTTTITAPQRVLGTFQFNYAASPGLTYVVQRAVTLPSWVPIYTNPATSGTVLFQDPSAPTNTAYYRVMRIPNP
ncbi:MAG TPA: Ig-like domain-containing protein [Verrucomicrobiae bacterium]|nr:Ig-like domain-containing protein [Verrucomicrobiae bacterium]